MSRRAGNGQSLRQSRALRRLSGSSSVVGGPRRRARPDGPRGDDVVHRAHRADPGGRRRPRAPEHVGEHDGRAVDERWSGRTVADDLARDASGDRTAWNRAFGRSAANDGLIDTALDDWSDRRDHPQLDGRYRRQPGARRRSPDRPVDHQPVDQPTGDDHDDDPPRGPDVRRLPGVPRRCVGDVPDRRRGNRFGHRYLDRNTDTFAYDHMHKPACIKKWRIWHISSSYR